MVIQTRGAAQSPPSKASKKLAKLQFHDKLVTKGNSTDALLKKLKTLHAELAELDQEAVDVKSLGPVRKDLMNMSLLMHKDKGVKAYVACCLADILRLFAPDAPYTQSELRDIFYFFFKQLINGLKGTDSPYYNEYFHLLESLSTVKSVVLVCDLQDADELMVDIFRDMFVLVRRDLPKKVEMFLADILIALIDECQSLPSEVLETIMSQFMDKNARIEQPAYRLAVQVCNATSDKLQRHVSQYFTDIIVSQSPAESTSPEEFEEIRTAHDLIKRLHRSCPSLLHSVIPQLEEELRVEEVQLRLIVTQILGEMYGVRNSGDRSTAGSGQDLVKKYPATWTLWMNRRNDKNAAIRLKFVEAAGNLIGTLPEYEETIEDSLRSKLLDPDEKVRAAVCKVYSQLDYETALHHVTEEQLHAVADRGLDKKYTVRLEALNSIGKLFSLAYPEIENNDANAVKHFGWIPNRILNMLPVGIEVRPIIEQIVAQYILPLPLPSATSTSKNSGEVDERAWTDRLLLIMRYLDEKAIQALLVLTGFKNTRPTIYEHFVDVCVKNNGGIIDDNEEAITRKLNLVIQHISSTFLDAHKASEDLNAFAKLNEGRLYKLLKTCMDPQTDLKGLVKATNEFLRRIEQASGVIAPTMTTLLYRTSFRILNQSSIPTFIKRMLKAHTHVTSLSQITAKNVQTLMIYISKHCPALYRAHVAELVKATADDSNTHLVEVCLQALAAVAKWDANSLPTDQRVIDRVEKYALDKNVRYAKFTARLLAFTKDRDERCSRIVESIATSLASAEPDLLLAHISVLNQFVRFAPDAFEHKSDVIMAFLLKQVLIVPIVANPDDMDVDVNEEWAEDEDISAVARAKILSIKVCRYRCISHAQSDSALEVSTPVFKLLATLIEQNGSLADKPEDPKVASRLRLQAALSLLHLSYVDKYAEAIAPKFLRLALTVQDSCYNVRLLFLTKLVTLLQMRRLPPRFNVIPFMTIFDPEEDVKATASAYVSNTFRKLSQAQKVEQFELIFIRLLHLLAHHPDFARTHNELIDMTKYIQFYLDLIANSETVSLLYHLAAKAKTVRDAESHTHSENLYVLSELAQELIKVRAHLHSWSIQSYPGKVKMPSDILRPLPSAEAANKILRTTYLTEETLAWIGDLAKPMNKEKKERKVTSKRKVSSGSKTNGHARRSRTKAKKWNSDESEGEEPSSTSDEDEDEQMEDVHVAKKPRPSSDNDDDENDDNEQGEESEKEEDLGRGARTRAKARQKKLKKHTKGKSGVR